MQKILHNGSVLTYSASIPPCIAYAHAQRRSVSRNTAINRGLRQGIQANQTFGRQRDTDSPWKERQRIAKPQVQQDNHPSFGKRDSRLAQEERDDTPLKWNQQDNIPRRVQRDYHPQSERLNGSAFPRNSQAREYREGEEKSPLGFDKLDTTTPFKVRTHISHPTDRTFKSFSPNEIGPVSTFGNVSRSPRENSQSPSKRFGQRSPERFNSLASEPRLFDGPVSIPYTTAASEFLFGYASVFAALKAHRRKLYKIYLHPRSTSREGGPDTTTVRRLAEEAKVQIVDVNDGFVPVMDKMSNARPHNGCILEASPLPRLPVSSLVAVENKKEIFKFQLKPQIRDELAINGFSDWLPYKSADWRPPFVLFVTDVLNPGNLGAIIRSAYFLGVDAIALSTRSCAPLNAEAVKASAGAIEAIPILAIENESTFLKASGEDGRWLIFCATTPEAPEETTLAPDRTGAYVKYTNARRRVVLPDTYKPLKNRPVILVVGGEHAGLPRHVTRLANNYVEIVPGVNALDAGVDSLNVSAASAILCAEFLRPPAGISRAKHLEIQRDGPLEPDPKFPKLRGRKCAKDGKFGQTERQELDGGVAMRRAVPDRSSFVSLPSDLQKKRTIYPL